MPKNYTEEFLKHIDFLKNQRGVSFASIAQAVGINKNKMNAIKGGRSSADKEILDNLFQAYPELDSKRVDSTLEVENLKTENLELKNKIIELQEQLIKCQSKLLD